jgi:cell division protein ZapA
MAKISLSINGKDFGMECDDGQERRVAELGRYVDSKIRMVVGAGAANTESHLLVLTALMLADEIFELRDNLVALGDHVENREQQEQQELMLAQTIMHMASRIDSLSSRIQKA